MTDIGKPKRIIIVEPITAPAETPEPTPAPPAPVPEPQKVPA
jgi:hypothetical protein